MANKNHKRREPLNKKDMMLIILTISAILMVISTFMKNISAELLLHRIGESMGAKVVEVTDKNGICPILLDFRKYLTEDEIKRLNQKKAGLQK